MEVLESASQIKNFRDLVVYKNLYKVMLIVNREIVPKLPREEKYDLSDQMRRGSKAGPALVAEGFAKRYQINHWRSYIIDTIGECNEMIHHLLVCIDLYSEYVDIKICEECIDIYETTCKQLTRLGQSWQNYHNSKAK